MRSVVIAALAIGCGGQRAASHSTRADDATMFVFHHACNDARAAAALVLGDDRVAGVALADSHDRRGYTPDTLVAQICDSLVRPHDTDLKIVGAVVVGPAGSNQGIRDGVTAQIVHFVMEDSDHQRSQFSHDVVWVQTPDGWRLAWIE
ncbi:MAG TPA: hypothetical protein VGL61_16545 [Kofleriaceae bacterium]|jgi:hypothetical protein